MRMSTGLGPSSSDHGNDHNNTFSNYINNTFSNYIDPRDHPYYQCCDYNHHVSWRYHQRAVTFPDIDSRA